MDDVKPGQIYNQERYLRGKLLDHSGWYGKLPRRITPSDIDFVFDNGKCQMLCELSSRRACWAALSAGQRRLYENLVKSGFGTIEAVCCWHADVPTINTFDDVIAFQVMRFAEHGGYCVGDIIGGEKWRQHVLDFFN